MSKPWDIIDEAELREMRVAGATTVDIAEHFQCPQRWVTYRCNDLNIASAFHSAGRGNGGEADWQSKAAHGSAALLAAIMHKHPERFAA